MSRRWTFTRRDGRANPPSITIPDSPDPEAARFWVLNSEQWKPKGSLDEGGIRTPGTHGLTVPVAVAPGAQIKETPIAVIGRGLTTAERCDDAEAAASELARVIAPATNGRGLIDVEYRWQNGTLTSGLARIVDRQHEAVGGEAFELVLDVELVDGVLRRTTEDVTTVSGGGTVTITNDGNVEDVWALVEIVGSADKVTVRNLDWAGDSPRGAATGFTLYGDPEAAANDDGDAIQPTGTVVENLDGFVVDSGRRTVVNGAGERRDGLLARRDWHPHFLPLHYGDNQVEILVEGGADVTIRRQDPFS